jgi:hypothetical protein
VAGEQASNVNFMPYQDYEFIYNMVPMQLGVLDLPAFSISKYGPKVSMLDDKQLFLLRGFT